MKLALYLPNFRNKVTVEELEDLTALAEDLDFNSVWTLDTDHRPRGLRPRRNAVPVWLDRRVPSWPAGVVARRVPSGNAFDPWLAAKMSNVRIGMSRSDADGQRHQPAGGERGADHR